MRPTLRLATAAVLAHALLSSACLSSSYRLSQQELSRLARTPPDQRWQAVRATQRFSGSDTPPDAAGGVAAPINVVPVPAVYWFHGRAFSVPLAWRNNPGAWTVRTATRASGGSSGSSSSGSSSRSGGAQALVVAVVVVAAAAMVFVLAGTEGARYDGWLGLPPDEPLYLDQPDGSTVAVPLSALTPALADGARSASVYEAPARRYIEMGRAPLDRQGFALQSSAVAAAVPRLGDPAGGYAAGFGGRAFLGGFPVHQLGLGATADVVAATDGAMLVTAGVEVQAMPVTYAGAYAGVGWALVSPGGPAPRLSSWFVRAGAQFEWPFTTRLTGTLRAGALRVDGDGATATLWAPEFSLGLAVY